MIAPNLTRIAREFNLTNYQRDSILGGGLSFTYNIVSFLVSLFVGYFGGMMDRKKLYVYMILIAQIGCLCTIFVTDLVGLFITRGLTGIGYGAVGYLYVF